MNIPNDPNISGPKILLQGEMGSGKTTSIRSLYELGYDVRVLSVEPGISDILGDLDKSRMHWQYIAPVAPNMEVLKAAATNLNTMHYDTIQKMGGINKQNHQHFFKLLAAMNNFKCDRTGETFGDIQTWGPDKVLVMDGLTGISKLAVSLTVGDKPFLEQRDYSAAQYLIANFVNTVVSSTRAWVVLTAHMERETDPNTGRTELMVSTVGKALAPVLPKYFSDVILCRMAIANNAPTWKWDTLHESARVKTRNLPLQQGLDANFKLLNANWQAKWPKSAT